LEFSIDRSSPIPYYIQVRDALQMRIQDGSWHPGDQIPGEPELCRMFDVSRTVIRQALNDLVYRGLLVRKKGKGTFVAEPKIRESLVQKLTGFHQDMLEQGYTPVTRVLKQGLVPANRKVAAYLGIEEGTDVVEIERLRFVQDEPIQLTTTYLPYRVCPELLHQDLVNQSLYMFLERQCGIMIARGHRSIEAVPANDYEARLLQVKKGAPLIMLNSVSFLSDGTPVEYYHALHRGDRTRFEVELVRVREQGTRPEVSDQELENLPLGSSLVLRNRKQTP
jgi:GntR family transcriptional regulator